MTDRLSWIDEAMGEPPAVDPMADLRNPDEVAQERRIGDALGQPYPAVRAYPGLFARRYEVETARNNAAPRLRRWLDDPNNMAIARDDVEQLSFWERIQQRVIQDLPGAVRRGAIGIQGEALLATSPLLVGESARQFSQGMLDVEQSRLGYRDYLSARGRGEVLSDADRARLDELSTRTGADDWGAFIVGPTARLAPQVLTSFQRAGQEGARGFSETVAQAGLDEEGRRRAAQDWLRGESQPGGALAQIPLLLGIPVGAFGRAYGGYISSGFEMETGAAFDAFVRAGADREIAAQRAEQYGLWASGIEFFGEAILARGLGSVLGRRGVDGALANARSIALRNATRDVGGGVASQALEESAQELAQAIHQSLATQQTATGESNVGSAWREALSEENIARILQAGYIGAQGGAGMVMIPSGARLTYDLNAIAQAEQAAQFFTEATQAAQSSLTAQRHRPSFESAVAAATGDPDVFLDADRFVEFMQTAHADPYRVAQEIGVSEAALVSALQSHGQIAMPVSVLAGRVLANPQYAALQEHVRVAPTADTIAELRMADEVFKAHTENLRAEMEAMADENEIGQVVEERVLELLDAAEKEAGPRREVSRYYAQPLAAFARTMVARAREKSPEYAQQLEGRFRAFFGEGFDIRGPSRARQGASQGEYMQGGRKGPPVREESWNPPEGVRMSERMRKVVEMAANGAGNAWIAEEMDISPRNVQTVLAQAKKALGGQAPWEAGEPGLPGVNTQTGEMTVETERLARERDKLMAAGYQNGRSQAGDNINSVLARRYDLSPRTVAVRLRRYDLQQKQAQREEVADPTPQSAMEQRRAWVDEHVVRHQVPGGFAGDYQHGFVLSSGKRMHIGIGDDGNGAAAIDWTFLPRLKAQDPTDSTTLYADGDERLSASEWRELRTAIQAVVEADAAKHERPAYVFTPQRESNRRSNLKMIEELGGLGYDLQEDMGSVYLVRPGASIDQRGRFRPHEGWTPNFEEPVDYGSQEEADDAQQAYYRDAEALSAERSTLSDVAEATRAERQENARSRAEAESLAGRTERGSPDGGRELEQDGGGRPLGGLTPFLDKDGAMRGAVMRLYAYGDGRSYNLATFLHETGHLFLEMFREIGADPESPADLQAMWADTLKWFGVTQAQWDAMDLDARTPYHEQWAQTFERWLMEGKAPSQNLAEAFALFKRWMFQVYQSVRQFLGVNGQARLTPEIESVFERLLATDQEIAEARAAMGSDFKLTREMFPGVSDEKFAELQAAVAHAEIEGETALRVRLFEAQMRKHKRWFRAAREAFRPAAERKVDSDRARRALEWLAYTEWRGLPDTELSEEGETGYVAPENALEDMPEGLPPMRLDAAATEAEWGGDVWTGLPAELRPLNETQVNAALDQAMALKRQGRGRMPTRLWTAVKNYVGPDGKRGIKSQEVLDALGSGRVRIGLVNMKDGNDPDVVALAMWEAGYFGAKPRRGEYMQFAGERARTADKGALGEAKERAGRGEDREAIRRDLGWFQGPDDKWRFEIADREASIDERAWATLQDKRRAASQWQVRLDKLLHHDALFAAYPQFAKVKVNFTEEIEAGAGSFDPMLGVFRVGARSSKEQILETLLHESQHAIQEAERFDGGGDETVATYLRNRLPEPQAAALDAEIGQTVADRIGEKTWQREHYLSWELYRRIAGEAEAFDTWARRGMTDAELAETPPAIVREQTMRSPPGTNSAVAINAIVRELAKINPKVWGKVLLSAAQVGGASYLLAQLLPKLAAATGRAFGWWHKPEPNAQRHLRDNPDGSLVLKYDDVASTDGVLSVETPFKTFSGRDVLRGLNELEALTGTGEYMQGGRPETHSVALLWEDDNRVYGGEYNPWNLDLPPLQKKDIKRALDARATEIREFSELPDDERLWTNEQHAARIATLIRNGWDDAPIIARRSTRDPVRNADGSVDFAPRVIDGRHRLAAAHYKGAKNIRVVWADNGFSDEIAVSRLRAGGELFQGVRPPAPIFESAVLRAVERSTTQRASSAQWWATISKTPGVKKEELEWIGLEDWLKAQDGQVARDEVLAFVRANGVQVEETVLGGDGADPELQARLLPLIEERERLERSLDPLMPAIAQELFQDDPTADRRPTPRELLDALIADLKGERQIYSVDDEGAAAEMQARADALRWFEARDIDLNGTKEEIRAEIADALAREQSEHGEVWHPDEIAAWFGFTSGDEMLQAMRALKPRAVAIEDAIDQMAEEEHGDPMRDGTIEEAARLAAHTEAQARRIEIELQAIQSGARGLRGYQTASKAARAFAERQLSSMTVGQVRRFDTFLAGERRAARNAMDALKKGDRQTAALMKQRQLVSFHLYHLARAAAEEMDKAQRYFRKFERDTIRAKIHAPLLDQIDQALEGVDLRQKPLVSDRKRANFRAWYAEMQAEGLEHMVAVDADFLEAAMQTPFNKLTLEDARGMRDAVRNFEHIGRRWREVLASRDQRLLDEEVALMANAMATIKPIEFKRLEDQTPGILENADDTRQKWHATLSRVEAVAYAMDGHEYGGPVQQGLFRPLREARNREEVRQEQARQDIAALFERYYSDKERADMWTVRRFFPQVPNKNGSRMGRNFTKQELLAIALNTGNDYNMGALVDGERKLSGWNETQIRALLDSTLNRKDWEFVQAVWDYVDSFWPDIKALYEQTSGVAPPKVQPTPFVNRHGEWRGGYYHLQYDFGRDQRARDEFEFGQVQQAFGGFRMRTQTPNGFAKARQGSGGRPVMLDLSVLTEHVNGVIHDLEFRVPVLNAWRIIKHQGFRDAYVAAAGQRQYDELKPWLQFIATEKMPPETIVTGTLRTLRQNTPITLMGYAISTISQQPGGILGTAHKLGAGRVIGRLAQTVAQPWTWPVMIRAINARSQFMRARTIISQREIREMVQEINSNAHINAVSMLFTGSPAQKMQALDIIRVNIGKYSMFPMAFVDKMVSSIPWQIAYEDAIAGRVKNVEALNEADAVAYADHIIATTFGSGRPEDLPAIMRANELGKLITPAFSYFSTQYNQLYNDQIPGMMRGRISPMEVMCFVAMALVAQSLISAWAAGRWQEDDEEPEEQVKRLLADVLTAPFAGVPIIRDITRGVAQQTLVGRRPTGDMIPAFGAITSTTKAIGGTIEGLASGEGIDRETAKAIVMAVGYWFGLPGRQMWITGEGVTDIATGEDDLSDPQSTASELLLRDTR